MSDSFNNKTPTPNRRFIKRPDDKAMKSQVDDLRKEIEKLDLANNKLNEQINKAQISSDVVSSRNELQKQLKALIAKQSTIKTERNAINDQIKNVDAQMKKRIAEIQAQTSKNSFKTVGEIDQRINHLDALIGGGTLKLADERRDVKEMSSLRKLRKDFGAIEKVQILIDLDKAKIAELKTKLNGLFNKELNTEFEKIQKELDDLNKDNASITKKRSDLYDERTAIKTEKDAKWEQIRTLRASFDEQFKKFKNSIADEQKKREEEEKSQKVEERQKRKKDNAEKQLAEAAVPAFTAELDAIHNLLHYFDSSYVKPAPKTADSAADLLNSTTASGRRVIEMPTEAVVIKKEAEDYFTVPTKGKKGKGKKSKAKAFTVDPEIIIALSDLSIPFPTKEEEVENTTNILKETLSALEAKQDEQTKINIERAKARVAALEAKDDEEEEEEEEGDVEENEE